MTTIAQMIDAALAIGDPRSHEYRQGAESVRRHKEVQMTDFAKVFSDSDGLLETAHAYPQGKKGRPK